jgi:hypothetical protein
MTNARIPAPAAIGSAPHGSGGHSFAPSRCQLGARLNTVWTVLVFSFLGATGAQAFTVADLLAEPKLTPKHFADHFEDFEFGLHPFDVQDPELFLSSRRGDCIDYAVLADYVLKRDGYGTRMIRVAMVGLNMGHAVCYVTESGAYLDYNNRVYFIKLKRSSPRIRAIADKVADSFDASWSFATEFTYTYDEHVKRAVMTVVKTDPPEMDPDAYPASGLKPKTNY